MGVEKAAKAAKCIAGFIWKVTKVSMKFCFKYMKKYPYAATVLLVLSLLFVFSPLLFFCLLFSSPAVAFIVISIKFYIKWKRMRAQKNEKNEEGKTKVEEPKPVGRKERPVIHKQLSRRRNLKPDIELDESLNVSVSDVIMTSQSVRNDRKLDGEENGNGLGKVDDKLGKMGQDVAKGDEKGKSEVEETGHLIHSRSVDCMKFGLTNVEEKTHLVHSKSIDCGKIEAESSDEEEAPEEGKKAVEWTEDDQQNLMDLGDSEMERNKRLESLIAKRRARKLFRMAIDKKLLLDATNLHIPPMLKTNLLNVMPHSVDENLAIPGSAPSVLLPRNPFDLPYDPMEEKPDLTADSFHLEFMPAQVKEQIFCRHEGSSSSSGSGIPASVSDSKQQSDSRIGHDKRTNEGHSFSRFRSMSCMSDHDQLIDELLFQEDQRLRNASNTDDLQPKKPKTTSEKPENKGKQKPQSVKGKEIAGDAAAAGSTKENDDSEASTSTDESELSFSGSIPTNIEILESKGNKIPPGLSDRIQNSLTFQVPAPPGFFDPSAPTRDRFFKRQCHSPGYSVASDLQVEVSEVGSPPFTGDGDSLYDEELLLDTVPEEVPEEVWGTPSHLAGLQSSELKALDVSGVTEDDMFGVGFLSAKQDLAGSPVAAPKLSEEGTSKDFFSEKVNEGSEETDNALVDNVVKVAEEVRNSSPSQDSVPSANPEDAKLLSQDSSDQQISDTASSSNQNLQEQIESTGKSLEGVNDNVTDQVEQSKKGEASSESTRDINSNAETVQATGKNVNDQASTSLEKRIEEILAPEENPGALETNQDDLEGTSEGIARAIDVVEHNPVDQVVDNPTTSILGTNQNETNLESLDRATSASFDELVHQIDVPKSVVDDIFRNNSLEDGPLVYTELAFQSEANRTIPEGEENLAEKANVDNVTNPASESIKDKDGDQVKDSKDNLENKLISAGGLNETTDKNEEKLETKAPSSSESIEDNRIKDEINDLGHKLTPAEGISAENMTVEDGKVKPTIQDSETTQEKDNAVDEIKSRETDSNVTGTPKGPKPDLTHQENVNIINANIAEESKLINLIQPETEAIAKEDNAKQENNPEVTDSNKESKQVESSEVKVSD